MTTTTTHRIESIEVRRQDDYDADLSYLDQTDAQMGEGFEAYAAQRKAAYWANDWGIVGVDARAIVCVGGVRQEITSGGLWGIESDSGEDYFTEIESEQLDELAGILRALGFTAEQIEEAKP